MKTKTPSLQLAFAMLVATASAIVPARAIHITVVNQSPKDGAPEHPDDPGSAKLFFLAQKAATYWENRFPNAVDPHTITMQFSYAGDVGASSGYSNVLTEFNGRPTVAEVRIHNTNLWFYDDDPYDHSEYDMVQTLARDLSSGQAATAFGPAVVPGVLEVSYEGAARSDAPADAKNNQDMYSILLHEIGHNLGMSSDLSTCLVEVNNGIFDADFSLTNSNVIPILQRLNGSAGIHTAAAGSLMRSGLGNFKRRLPSALDMLAIATCPDPGWFDLNPARQDFFPGGTSVWNTATNWLGASLPGSNNDVAVRHSLNGAPKVVNLTGSGFCKDFLLTTRTGLRTGANPLRSFGTATILYDEINPGVLPIPKLRVETGGSFRAVNADVRGGEFSMEGGTATIDSTLTLNADTGGQRSKLLGSGALTVGTKLINHGLISPLGTLTFNSVAATPWDLDGPTGGGELVAIDGDLDFASGGLSDPFDGEMRIWSSHSLRIFNAWPLGAGGVVKLLGSVGVAAELRGGTITATSGAIESSGKGLIDAPLILGGTASVDVAAGGTLELARTTAISGGVFQVNSGAALNFTGPQSFSGGNFNGLGTISLQGANTTISGATEITCGIVKLDGLNNPAKKLILDSKLTVNAVRIDLLDNSFDSILEINNTGGNLTIDGPSAWAMNGTLRHVSGSALLFPSISGAPFSMNGTTEVTGGTRWDARTTITGTVGLPAPGDKLGLGGGTELTPNRIEGGAVTGNGALRAFNSHLSGFGTIAAKILFETGSTLLADDGTLLLSGGFTEVPPLLGTADGDGTLDVTTPWSLPPANVLELRGGIVQGETLTSSGAIRGTGTLRPKRVINNGSISGTGGGSLVIDTQFPPDLDGTGSDAEVAGHLLNAIAGDLTVATAPSDAFGGTASVTAGRTLDLVAGWTIDAGGTLNLIGNTPAAPATLAGGVTRLLGTLHAADTTRIPAPVTFANGCSVTFADNATTVATEGIAAVEAGADFSGDGRLVVAAGGQLTLADASTVGVHLVCENGAVIVGDAAATATVAEYTQAAAGNLQIQLSAAPDQPGNDSLKVLGHATLGGTLSIALKPGVGVAGDSWKVLGAGSLSGAFSGLVATGVPPGHVLSKFETGDGVFVKLARSLTFSEWAGETQLPPGNDLPGDDADDDGLANAIEMLLGTDPNVADSGILPPQKIVKIDGLLHLSISIPLQSDLTASDMQLIATRSTNLVNWSTAGVAPLDEWSYDPVTCIAIRTFFSETEFGAVPREFMCFELIPTAP